MVKYVNAVSCAYNNEGKKLLVDFSQEFPRIGEEGFDDTVNVSESVATILMDLDLVEKLHDHLEQILNAIQSEDIVD